MKAAILGTGSWGCAFGMQLASTWDEVFLWGIDPEQVDSIRTTRTNPDYLGDIVLPQNLHATRDLDECLRGAEAVFVVVPSQVVRQVMNQVAASDALSADAPIVNLAKGFEVSTLKRASEVIADELQAAGRTGGHPIGVLLGPSHAEEVALGLPTAIVLSGQAGYPWDRLQEKISGPSFRVYTNDDLVGVEIASGFKNVIALAVGMVDGLGGGDNTRGTLMCRGLAELARLGEALGGRRETFFGLAGIGDMITTCISRHSRNRNFGEAVTQHEGDPQELLGGRKQVVEGVFMTQAALKLSDKLGIELPVTKQVHDVLFSRKAPQQAVRELMERQLKTELD